MAVKPFDNAPLPNPADPLVIATSRGSKWTQSRISAEHSGNYALAIRAAVESLYSGEVPVAAAIIFDPYATSQCVGTPPPCDDPDPDHETAPCQLDRSDLELNYVEIPSITATNPDAILSHNWSGTVWIYRKVAIDRPLLLRRNCTLDFLGNQVELIADTTFVSGGQGTEWLQFGAVRNVTVIPFSSQMRPIFRLNALPGVMVYPNTTTTSATYIKHGGIVEFCAFENITIKKVQSAAACFDGIHLFSSGGQFCRRNSSTKEAAAGQWMQWNTFRNIHMEWVRRAIFIEKATWNSEYINGNVFVNVQVRGFRRLVEFKTPIMCDATDRVLPSGFAGVQAAHFNSFIHVVGETFGAEEAIRTEHGFMNIYGNGNRLDHVGLVKWENASGQEYSAIDSKKVGSESGEGDGLSPSYLCAYSILPEANAWTSDFMIDAPDPVGSPGERPLHVPPQNCNVPTQKGRSPAEHSPPEVEL